MSEALSALRVPIDPGQGGVLLANMLASWLDQNRSWTANAEARDESQDSRTSPPQARLHLPAPVDAGPSPPPSGEHGAPVRLAREGAGTGLERIPDSHPRPGFGKDGNGDDAAGGLQDFSGRCLDGQRLLELCAFTSTLVIDEDGCYDPADFNDGLLLGLNRPDTQNTPCSTSRRPLWTIFLRLRSRMPLARR